MGNGVSTDQGNLPPHGTRDVRNSDDTEQHEWSQLAEAPNTDSALLSSRKPYSGAQARGQKSTMSDDNLTKVLQKTTRDMEATSHKIDSR